MRPTARFSRALKQPLKRGLYSFARDRFLYRLVLASLGFGFSVSAFAVTGLCATPDQPLCIRGFGEAGLDYDSNIYGTTAPQVFDDGFVSSTFGVDSRRPWGMSQFSFDGQASDDNKGLYQRNSLFKYYGGSFEWPRYRFSDPFMRRRGLVDRNDYLRLNTFGMEWRHRLDDNNLFNIAAQYGGYQYETANPHSAKGYAASLGWNGIYHVPVQPRIGGKLFVGSETADDTALKYFGRRYYGVSADGSVSLFKDHSPYISFKFQRSDYEDADPISFINRRENYSRLAAGWNWQVLPHWQVRAQADYSANRSNLSLYEYDAGRLFFSTRFDFR